MTPYVASTSTWISQNRTSGLPASALRDAIDRLAGRLSCDLAAPAAVTDIAVFLVVQ